MYNNTIQMQLMKAPRISSGYNRTMLILINLLTRSAACLERISNRYERTVRSQKFTVAIEAGPRIELLIETPSRTACIMDCRTP